MVLHALAFAGLAAPARGVEREAARGVAAHARFAGVGEQLADRRPRSRRRSPGTSAASCRSASGRLRARGRPAPSPRCRRSRRSAGVSCGRARRHAAARDSSCSTSRASVDLARARHAGDDRQPAERDAHVDVLRGCAGSRRRSRARGVAPVDRAARLQRMLQRLREKAAGDRMRDCASAPRPCPARRLRRRACPRRARDRSRARRAGSCPRRARRRPACCLWLRACASVSSRIALSRGCRPMVGSSRM